MMAELHDRMPLSLEPEDWPTCLGDADGDRLRCSDRPLKPC